MRAMLLDAPGRPLRLADLPRPEPGTGHVLLSVRACGVCRTDLHVADGDLPNAKLPLILGHEIVGMVAAVGAGSNGCARATGSASPGSAGPAVPAATAARGARTC